MLKRNSGNRVLKLLKILVKNQSRAQSPEVILAPGQRCGGQEMTSTLLTRSRNGLWARYWSRMHLQFCSLSKSIRSLKVSAGIFTS